MMKEDMKRVAPLWLNFSKKVRHDPDVSNFLCVSHVSHHLGGFSEFAECLSVLLCDALRQSAAIMCSCHCMDRPARNHHSVNLLCLLHVGLESDWRRLHQVSRREAMDQ